MPSPTSLRKQVETLQDRLNGLTALVIAHIRYPTSSGPHYQRLLSLVEQSLKLQKEDTEYPK